ncbi:xylulokinase [Blautia liquoris]|mgnify:CR=1 FL=1|uniref:Xylulose kinase n=1 Tax=Blautia liquoris TaxID=2779518 RepID=A0A7M2RHX1_9FIRM|nr:xylulokinase [Blautia liquoris]QOV19936.1 xylulokinase [Blautia liquoris]
MDYLMGIDLGTSSLKTLIMERNGKIIALSKCRYDVQSPMPGYMEQDPKIWWQACVQTIRDCLYKSGINSDEIASLGFSGQMHGLVLLDNKKELIRPAILHNDARSGDEVKELYELLGMKNIQEHLMNPLFTGSQITSLYWMKKNEVRQFRKIRYILSPKDYLLFRLTGVICTDYSDASATLLYDIKENRWWKKALECIGLSDLRMAPVQESIISVGKVLEAAGEETGISKKTVVCVGGGDQVMQALGNGVVEPGKATVTIGSSGQIFIPTDCPVGNPNYNMHTFCGAQENTWFSMGAILSAGLSLKWAGSVLEVNDFAELSRRAELAPAGSGGILFLPYLNGERTPHMNPMLRGGILGLNTKTGTNDFVRSVMEGVAFALREAMETCLQITPDPTLWIASGGGTQSNIWMEILADILGKPLYISKVEENAAVGAAITAGVGAGVYRNLKEGCKEVVSYQPDPVVPDVERIKQYEELYQIFKESYTANKMGLEKLSQIQRRDQDA